MEICPSWSAVWVGGGGAGGSVDGNDELEPLEIVAIETFVARDEAVALEQGMRADEEIRHRAGAGAATLAVAALHLAGAQRGFRFQRAEADAHVLQHGEHIGAIAQ